MSTTEIIAGFCGAIGTLGAVSSALFKSVRWRRWFFFGGIGVLLASLAVFAGSSAWMSAREEAALRAQMRPTVCELYNEWVNPSESAESRTEAGVRLARRAVSVQQFPLAAFITSQIPSAEERNTTAQHATDVALSLNNCDGATYAANSFSTPDLIELHQQRVIGLASTGQCHHDMAGTQEFVSGCQRQRVLEELNREATSQ